MVPLQGRQKVCRNNLKQTKQLKQHFASHVALEINPYVHSFTYNIGIGRTDRQTDRNANNIALCVLCMQIRDKNIILL